tara:strand:+ start:1125 stop:1355 length:231 start_codon:yes stop_codon:yes gene_type:complete
MKDKINPDHYKSGEVECIDALETVAAMNPYPKEVVAQCNTIKYLWRYHSKHEDQLEDLHKAKWYLERLIKNVKARS